MGLARLFLLGMAVNPIGLPSQTSGVAHLASVAFLAAHALIALGLVIGTVLLLRPQPSWVGGGAGVPPRCRCHRHGRGGAWCRHPPGDVARSLSELDRLPQMRALRIAITRPPWGSAAPPP
jgi:hypothetical protein